MSSSSVSFVPLAFLCAVAGVVAVLCIHLVRVVPAPNVNVIVKAVVCASWLAGSSVLALVPADVVVAASGRQPSTYMDVLWQINYWYDVLVCTA